MPAKPKVHALDIERMFNHIMPQFLQNWRHFMAIYNGESAEFIERFDQLKNFMPTASQFDVNRYDDVDTSKLDLMKWNIYHDLMHMVGMAILPNDHLRQQTIDRWITWIKRENELQKTTVDGTLKLNIRLLIVMMERHLKDLAIIRYGLLAEAVGNYFAASTGGAVKTIGESIKNDYTIEIPIITNSRYGRQDIEWDVLLKAYSNVGAFIDVILKHKNPVRTTGRWLMKHFTQESAEKGNHLKSITFAKTDKAVVEEVRPFKTKLKIVFRYKSHLKTFVMHARDKTVMNENEINTKRIPKIHSLDLPPIYQQYLMSEEEADRNRNISRLITIE